MSNIVLIKQDNPSVHIQANSTVSILDNPDIVNINNNAKIIISNLDTPIIVNYSTQTGADGHTPTTEEITNILTPEIIISKLTGEIRASELYGSLAQRIDTIGVLETAVNNIQTAIPTFSTIENTATILNSYSTIVDTASAVTNMRDQALSIFGVNLAYALTDYTTTANLDGAIATKVDTLIASTGTPLGNLSADVQIEQKVRTLTTADNWFIGGSYTRGRVVAAQNGDLYQSLVSHAATELNMPPNSDYWSKVEANLYSGYEVKTDVNGHIAGFGLSNDGLTSNFIVRADKFAVTDGTEEFIPFIVTEGKVFIKDAMVNTANITDASVTTAKIEDASIINAKIGEYIASSDYDGDTINPHNNIGTTGWCLSKTNGAVFRGAVTFAPGSSGYNNLTDRPVYKGGWNSAAVIYIIGDTVGYNNSTYICIESHESNALLAPVNDIYWALHAGAGENGINTVNVYIYKRSTGTPLQTTVTSSYTFSTATLTSLDNGWSTAVTDETGDLYVCVATAVSKTDVYEIAYDKWSVPRILSQVGADGLPGVNNAIVYLYQRTTTAIVPSKPNINLIYDFITGELQTDTGSWLKSMPATGGTYRWMTTNVALSKTGETTVSIPLTWSEPVIISQDGVDGADGINGNNSLPVFLYAKNTSSSAAPLRFTGVFTVTFATKNVVTNGSLNSWSFTAPTITNGEYLWMCSAIASNNELVDTIPESEFSIAKVIGIGGLNGANGSNNAIVKLYRKNTSSSVAPAAFSGDFTYIFATGLLTGGTLNGWTAIPPSLVAGEYLWVRQIIAISVNDSCTLSSANFSGAVVSLSAPLNGTPGQTGASTMAIYIDNVNPTTPPNSVGIPTSWSNILPTTATYAIWESIGNKNIGESTYTWSKPKVSTVNWVKSGTTTIDGNKIYTGDAYVDTLQIKGNAIWLPLMVEGTSSFETIPIGNSYHVISFQGLVSPSYDFVGGKGLFILKIQLSANIRYNILNPSFPPLSTTFGVTTLLLKRSDGAIIASAVTEPQIIGEVGISNGEGMPDSIIVYNGYFNKFNDFVLDMNMINGDSYYYIQVDSGFDDYYLSDVTVTYTLSGQYVLMTGKR